MAHVYANRVKETSVSTGTGALALLGPVLGYQTFVSKVGAGNSCIYTIENPITGEWETGFGTISSGPATLTRTTIFEGSNGSSPVNFGAGVKTIFVTVDAAFFQDIAGPSILTYGGIGDGVADDSGPFAELIDESPDNSPIVLPGGGTYRITTGADLQNRVGLTFVGYGATILLDGVDASAVRFVGTNNHKIKFLGIGVQGSGDVADNQQGFGSEVDEASGGSVIEYEHCWFDGVVRGIYHDVLSVLGDYRNIYIHRCDFRNILGTVSGKGYGAALSGVWGARISRCFFDQVQRHSAYVSASRNVSVDSNYFRRHRDTVRTGGQVSALAIARSSHVGAKDNDFEDCCDGSATIEPHETNNAAHCESNSFNYNRIRNTTAVVGDIDIFVGSGSPDDGTTSELRDTEVVGNKILRIEDASVGTESLRVRSGLGVLIEANRWRMDNAYTVGKFPIYLAADGGATHCQHIIVGPNNYLKLTLGVGGGAALVEVGSPLCVGASPVWIGGNKSEQGLYREVVFDSPPTSEELIHQPSNKSRSPATLTAGDILAFDIFTATELRLVGHASGSRICGITHGCHSRRWKAKKIGGGTITLGHEIAGAAAQDRIKSPTGADVTLTHNSWLCFDAPTQRWWIE